jgi:hypothetical protein
MKLGFSKKKKKEFATRNKNALGSHNSNGYHDIDTQSLGF